MLIKWILTKIIMPTSIFWIIFKALQLRKIKIAKKKLSGKVVVITGASSGLGEALANIFFRAGCKVILAARRKHELERVKNSLLQIKNLPITYEPTVVEMDLKNLDTLPNIASKIIENCGEVDILVNNGGISIRADAIYTTLNVDMEVMMINYFGSIAITKALLPQMIKKGEGRVVFISSVQGKFSLPFRSAYSASKHAIQAFSDSLRAETAKTGVKISCISPGYIKTSLSVNALTANGSPYGKMDETTAKGESPDQMAKQILYCILKDEKDVMLSNFQAKSAYFIRHLFPALYFKIMENRC